MAQRLYQLLDQLLAISPDGRNLRKAFHDNPNGVTVNLDAASRAALYTMVRSNISTQVGAEIAADYPNDHLDWVPLWTELFEKYKFPKDEFPKADLPVDCDGPDGELPEYPDPQPRVYKITPTFVNAGSVATLSIEVVGQGLVTGKVLLEFEPKQGAQPIVVSNQQFAGTFRCGHLTADLTVPAAVTNVGKKDRYRVVVKVEAGNAATPKPISIKSNVMFEVRP